VTSVDCGWRKPHDRAFAAAAAALDAPADDLLHVGDDPRADGGGATAGVTVLLTTELPLVEVPARLEDRE
jgi:FMN phosphatase YigB (HAD superfamily)